jgi:dipeptidyl aminopeptidase/acylaminoacyl peptidase
LVDMFGPTDMVDLYDSLTDPLERFGLRSLLSGTPDTNPGLYQSSSPVHFVSAQNPPTLILHGALDPIVPVSQSIALKEKLQLAGVPVQMVTYPTESHGWTGANLLDTYNRIAGFLAQHNP